MSGRPWLEALKKSATKEVSESSSHEREKLSNAPGKALTKPTKLSRPAGEVQNVTDIRTARALWGEAEHRLLAAGWSPKERCGPLGLTIWANPKTGFYCSQEVALYRMDQSTDTEGEA